MAAGEESAADKSTVSGDPVNGDAVLEAVVCPACEQPVARGAAHCPHCHGDDGRRGAAKRGAFIGGVIGLLGGGLAVAVWSPIVGPQQATWGPVLSIMAAAAVIGIIVGALRSRAD